MSMPLEPRSADLPRVRGAVKFYQVAAIITGVLLLLLCTEMVLKYAVGIEVEAFGPKGLVAFVPAGSVTAVNLSTGILMVHGWFYVVYLFADFRLWSLMRWPFTRFLVIALGGVIPFLSFFLETRFAREVNGYLDRREAADAARASDSSSDSESVEAAQ